MNQKSNQDFTDVLENIAKESNLSEQAKSYFLKQLHKLKKAKINILITGATGCGKSSTINALFEGEVAKVGQGSNPETMTIQQYELNNIILWDSPGLGDGKEADQRHAKNIINKLQEKDKDGNALIDLVLVILDGSSRDLGTSYELINRVIIPNMGKNIDRLLVAINQCDVAMKGRYWNEEKNEPEPKLVAFLEDKVESTKQRIKEATGVDIVDPIYYSAGFKDGDEEQQPYNLSKLLYFIVSHTKEEKRMVYLNDINSNKKVWEKDDKQADYNKKTTESLWDWIGNGMGSGGDIGEEIGSKLGLGLAGRVLGSAIGAVAGAVAGIFSWLF